MGSFLNKGNKKEKQITHHASPVCLPAIRPIVPAIVAVVKRQPLLGVRSPMPPDAFASPTDYAMASPTAHWVCGLCVAHVARGHFEPKLISSVTTSTSEKSTFQMPSYICSSECVDFIWVSSFYKESQLHRRSKSSSIEGAKMENQRARMKNQSFECFIFVLQRGFFSLIV